MITGKPLDHVCVEICSFYKDSFPDDADFEREIQETSGKLLKAMRLQFKDKLLASAMTQLQFCIVNYELDGKKKRKRLLGGTWFTRAKSPNSNRAKDCLRNVTVYHTGTMTGMFPIAPDGWSLENR
jgi:hypothetical protein